MKTGDWLKTTLSPLSALYGFVTTVRNLLYDKKIFRSEHPGVFSISVGNLTVGGTGKTPMVEYLTRSLQTNYHIAILSRGYGRKTKGFVLAKSDSTAADIGDEPLQYFRKFTPGVRVAVCEKRPEGAQRLIELYPETNLLLLDDAFQHRPITPHLQILLNDYNRPFYKDQPFPRGRLRETRYGSRRADCVIVTKCPSTLTQSQRGEITANIRKYSGTGTPVFFSTVSYGEALGFDGQPVSLKKVKAVAGIASPQPFLTFLSGRYEVVTEELFADHYNYEATDVQRLIKNLKSDTFVLTTEKDMVKLLPLAKEINAAHQFAYIPVFADFGQNERPFQEWLAAQIPYFLNE